MTDTRTPDRLPWPPPRENVDVLRGVPFLALLPDPLRALVIELLEPRGYQFGDVIIRQGDAADGLYILASGTARVLMTGEDGTEATLSHLSPGATFGEAALLDGSPRTATVRASSPASALVLERRVYSALERVHPEIAGALDSHRRAHTLQRFLRTHSAFSSMSMEGLREMAAQLTEADFGHGDRVLTEGSPADCLLIVLDGRLRVFRTTDGSNRDVGFLRTGDAFGEAALEPGAVRGASVEALTDVRLLRLDAIWRGSPPGCSASAIAPRKACSAPAASPSAKRRRPDSWYCSHVIGRDSISGTVVAVIPCLLIGEDARDRVV